MLEVIQALGPLYTFLVVLVVCLTLLGTISRVVMLFEKRRGAEQSKPTPTEQL